MAGRGQRFRDAGFEVPKFEIEVRGRSLFRWAMDSLGHWTEAGAQVIFLTRAEDEAVRFLNRECDAEGIRHYDVIELETTTDGQATTALLAGPAVRDQEAPFLIYNIDTHVRRGAMTAPTTRVDGWIPVFPGAGAAWSFAAVDDLGMVTGLREKVRISPHATVGLYWFGSFAMFDRLYADHFAAGGSAAGERYVAPMYNTLIDNGAAVRLQHLVSDDVTPLGTPAEVAQFASSASGVAPP
jgi:hypothetical protein